MKAIITKGIMLAVMLALVLPGAVLACENCFGANVDTPVTQGIAVAMMSLLGVTTLMVGGIGMFFLNMKKRARMFEKGNVVVTEHGYLVESDEDQA